jgi:hypothetical protein
MKTEKGMLKTQFTRLGSTAGWLRMTCQRRDWTPHLGNRADALVPEPRLMNDGEGSLAFSAGNRDHYTLGCASCKMVVMKRLISEVGSNFDAAAHPGTVSYGNTLSYRITAARHRR